MEQSSAIELIGDSKVKIMLWDTDSNRTHQSIRNVYYKKAHLIFVVQDLSLCNSTEGVMFWVNSIKGSNSTDSLTYLIGAKTDISDVVLSLLEFNSQRQELC